MVANINVSLNNCVEKTPSIQKLVNNLLVMPNWVKQYVYVVLRDDLRKSFDIDKLDKKQSKELIHLYVPTPTAYANRIIQRRFNQNVISFNITAKEKQFLQSVGLNKTLIDICNDNKWSLLRCSKVLVNCIDKGYIEGIENFHVYNTVYYLAGRIRLGEYLLRMNKLSLEQVDRALYAQKEIEDKFGQKTKIGELMVNLGFINNSDKNEILQMKDNSVGVCNVYDETESLKSEIDKLKKSLEVLKFENQGIKEDLVFYQEELLSKSRIIAELEQKNEKLSKKEKSIFRFFKLNIREKTV